MKSVAADWPRALLPGSGALINVGTRVVTKSSGPEEVEKLQNEAEWLSVISDAPEHIRSHFPRVFALPTHQSPTIRMQKLPGRTGREMALLASPDVRNAAGRAVRFAVDELFLHRQSASTPTVMDWYMQHVSTSLRQALHARPHLNDVLTARYLRMHDGVVENPLYAGTRLIRAAIDAFVVPNIGLVHGDLHLGNLLVDRDADTFYWIDPRGRFGASILFDPAYDVAKLLHESLYVAARARAAEIRLRIDGDACVVETVHLDGKALATLGHLTKLSLELASLAARARSTDLQCAARATFVTGLLFVSMLRLQSLDGREWQTILGYGLQWLRAGIEAIQRSYGFGRCYELWRNLHMDLIPTATASVPIGLLQALRDEPTIS